MLVSIDFETSGTEPGYHEVIQAAFVPTFGRPFVRLIKPTYPERSEPGAVAVHNIDATSITEPGPDESADLLYEWWLECCGGVHLTPLAHNWAFENAFIRAWLGGALFDRIFHYRAICTQQLARSVNMLAVARLGKPVFKYVGLAYLCKKLGVENAAHHDAYNDAVAAIELYEKLKIFVRQI